MANKYAKEKEVVVKSKAIIFQHYWKGTRKPEFVIFPNGRKSKVDYMKDGKIAFDNGSFGSYKRTHDNNETQERIIIIEVENE
jgi:hypothetical protein